MPLPPQLIDRLQGIVGREGLLLDGDVHARTTQGMRPEPLRAGVLVRPKTTADVSAVLKLCHQARVAVVPQGGLTGLVHGTDAEEGDVILSLERMNAVENISASQRVAVVQAGVSLQRLQEAAEDAGLFFPVDLGARGTATVGGAVATNAGGNRVIRWGTMRDSVLGLEAVLADGAVLSSMNQVLKNNTGYDLKQLFIGAEGTLGVVTRIAVRLREAPVGRAMGLAALDSFEHVIALLKHMDRGLNGTLSAFEVLWDDFYELVTTAPALSRPPLPHGHSHYVLLECLGGDPTRDQERFESALGEAMEAGLVADASIAQTERDCAALWAMRDDVQQMGRFGHPFAYDVSLPLANTEAYTHALRAGLHAAFGEHRCWFYGHLGDGNLHVVVQVPHPDAAAHAVVDALVYEPLAAQGGAISAEHGIGLDKKAWLHVSRNPVELTVMRRLKQALDPLGILNPGKLLPD
ncbi:FAD-binding oxidoreductase [Aquabacterium sp. J223]|uniref:FAD-binding oxidoreductase n=1 Tax=Aquabacterium sp. J223 TaxID=2898431 RepID=UPI0021AE0C95|nr:FAD-binding oxidoreductase [Aquabacterium sp. J223]UUX93997.1 FAD-binding oxidoreductase [Aquabacterium sp. J223]